jgi:uncharacterized membrane-anchored protein
MKHSFIPHVVLLACLAVFSTAQAQQPGSAPPKQPTAEEMKQRIQQRIDEIEKLGWTRQGKGILGDKAEIAIPQGYRFTAGDGTRKLMEMYGNPPTRRELGMLTTEGFGPWIIFSYDDAGHVKDDEKDKIDADALLQTKREQVAASNEVRKERGLNELALDGWAIPPRYNDKTHTLEWALKVKSVNSGGISINYETRLLGRTGVMEVHPGLRPG